MQKYPQTNTSQQKFSNSQAEKIFKAAREKNDALYTKLLPYNQQLTSLEKQWRPEGSGIIYSKCLQE